MKGSYAYLYANCAELYDRELASESSTLDPNVQQSGPKSLDFWPKLISLVVSVIEEDRGVYTHVLNQYEPLSFTVDEFIFTDLVSYEVHIVIFSHHFAWFQVSNWAECWWG